MLINAKGTKNFQDSAMICSMRMRRRVPRIQRMIVNTPNTLMKNHIHAGSIGPFHPARNTVATIAETASVARYSPRKKVPNRILEYSVT